MEQDRKKFWLEVSYPDDQNSASAFDKYIAPAVAAVGGFQPNMKPCVPGVQCESIHLEPPGLQIHKNLRAKLLEALAELDALTGANGNG